MKRKKILIVVVAFILLFTCNLQVLADDKLNLVLPVYADDFPEAIDESDREEEMLEWKDVKKKPARGIKEATAEEILEWKDVKKPKPKAQLSGDSDSGEKVELTFSLPKDISSTDFNSLESYHANKNGAEINLIGVPFLKDNVTYIPVRDLANAFDVEVSYNTDDRTVSLSTDGKMIIISPSRSFEKIGTVIINRESGKNNFLFGEDYLLKNNRSYVPLRFVMESLAYAVDYDEANKMIRISGAVEKNLSEGSFFTEEQELILDALRKFESENRISLVGSVLIAGKEMDVQAEIAKFSRNGSMIEEIRIRDMDANYLANKEMFVSGGITYRLSKITDSGEKEAINLMGWGSMHPYFYLKNTGVSGIEKYRMHNIKNLGLDGRIQRFAISNIENDEKIELGIDVDKRRLVDYIHQSLEKNIYNNFLIQY